MQSARAFLLAIVIMETVLARNLDRLASYLNFKHAMTVGYSTGFGHSICTALRECFWGAGRHKFLNGIQLRFVPDADVDVTGLCAACDFGAAYDLTGMFERYRSLHLDCSDWNIGPNTLHSDFNKYAPAVILPKAWQYTSSSERMKAAPDDSGAAFAIQPMGKPTANSI